MEKKTVKTIYWIVTILFAAFMLFSGISELVRTEAGDELFMHLGYPLYLNYILGVAKILGVIAITLPQFKILKEWAYAGFTFDLGGATLSFILNGDGFGAAAMPLVILAVMFVSYGFWKKMQGRRR